MPCGDGHAQNAYGFPLALLIPSRQIRGPCLHTGDAVPDAGDTWVGGEDTKGFVPIVELVVDKGASV